MEQLIKLNLQSDEQRAETATSEKRERMDSEVPPRSRRLNRMVSKAAHKAAKEFARSGSGIFSK